MTATAKPKKDPRPYCDQCDQRYPRGGGGHCRGGVWGGCCQTFGSNTAGDAHRVGPHHPPGQRRCLTPDEMRDLGWWQDDNGVWRLPKPDTEGGANPPRRNRP